MTLTKFVLTAAVIAASALAFVAPSTADSKGGHSWRDKVSADLLEEFDSATRAGSEKGQDEKDIDVIIQFAGGASSERRQSVRSAGGSVRKSLAVIEGLSAKLPLRAVQALASRDDLAFISPDRPVQLMGHLETTTGAAQARSMVGGISNLDGSGVGIAILDSGIDYYHHEFTYGGSRIAAEVDFGGFRNTDDYGGHGTHVASIAAGGGHIGPRNYTGVAPGASIINCKVLDRNGRGYTSDIIDAVNWCVAYRYFYNIKIINMSLGAPAIDSYQNDPLCRAVRAAHDVGIVVVAAAGNNGKDSSGTKLYGAIHSPGIEPSAITVGAINTQGTDSRADDVVATYSSRGPTRGYTINSLGRRVYDNLIKPDLVAPGNKIIGAQAYGADLVEQHPELDANRYETNSRHYVMYLSGSSVAAPVVSGAAALLLEANPSLTPNLVKAILTYSAQPLAGFNMLEQGAGALNIEGAVRLAKTIKNPITGLSNGQLMLASSSTKLAGIAFGTSPAWSTGSEFDKATDGNTATFFDNSQGSGGYTGIDLGAGNARKVVRIRFYPRNGFASRMVGGKFQGSNTSATGGYTDLYTISSTPATGLWTEVAISNQYSFRYLRYLGPNGGYCNIAEMEFITDSSTLPLIPQSTIAGHTFQWGGGVITNWSFLYGSNLMTYWQGMYGLNVLLANGSYYSAGQLLKSSTYTTSGTLLSEGVMLADGTLLAEGILVLNGQGTLLAEGITLSEGVMLADSRVTCDGTLLADGTLLSDGFAASVTGEGIRYMEPTPDSTSQ